MAPSSINTAQLHGWLERMRAGDLVAREEMLCSVCGRLEILARSMLQRFPNVKLFVETGDVLNSAMVRLLRSLKKLQPGSMREFYGLASEEIRRELLDLARHFYGPRGLGANMADAKQGDDSLPALDPPEPAEDQDEVDKWCNLHLAVEKLPTAEREVVGLVIYHGWSQEEIAELFQVSERTVRRWWKSALKTLRGALGQNGLAAPD